MKLRELAPIDRPRERLLHKGAAALSDLELLVAMLGGGIRGHDVFVLARQVKGVVDRCGSALAISDLLEIKGVGIARAALIVAAHELFRRRIHVPGTRIESPSEVLPLIGYLAGRKQEHFVSISLNGANEVLHVRVVAVGLADQVQIHPREVFADAITDRACSVIFAHNHPASILTPSPQDRETTTNLSTAGRVLGIRVIDHLIFNERGYFSMREQGMLS